MQCEDALLQRCLQEKWITLSRHAKRETIGTQVSYFVSLIFFGTTSKGKSDLKVNGPIGGWCTVTEAVDGGGSPEHRRTEIADRCVQIHAVENIASRHRECQSVSLVAGRTFSVVMRTVAATGPMPARYPGTACRRNSSRLYFSSEPELL